MTPDPIFTSRLCLRPFTGADRAALTEGLNDLAVSQWLARVPYPFSQADLSVMQSEVPSSWPDLMVIAKDTTVIGAVTTHPHFGFWIARRHWGNGYGREAASAALEFALERDSTVHSGYFAGNSASARILHGLGFMITSRGRTHCRALGRDLPDVTLICSTQGRAAA